MLLIYRTPSYAVEPSPVQCQTQLESCKLANIAEPVSTETPLLQGYTWRLGIGSWRTLDNQASSSSEAFSSFCTWFAHWWSKCWGNARFRRWTSYFRRFLSFGSICFYRIYLCLESMRTFLKFARISPHANSCPYSAAKTTFFISKAQNIPPWPLCSQ